MKLQFRIDFGFQMTYARRQYHAAACWDGHLECSDGVIEKTILLDYPKMWSCPCLSPEKIPLDAPRWKFTTRRSLTGLEFHCDVPETSVFTLKTASGTWTFSAAELLNKKELRYFAGGKYTLNQVVIMLGDYLWFRPDLPENVRHLEARELPLPVHEWARLALAWLAPGAALDLELDFPQIPGGEGDYLVHLAAMISPRAFEAEPVPIHDEALPDTTIIELVGMKELPKESQWHEEMELALVIDGGEPVLCRQFFREHDFFNQLLEDVWLRVRTAPGKHRIRLCHNHLRNHLLIGQLNLFASPRPHGKLDFPKYLLTNEVQTGRIYAAYADTLTLQTPEGDMPLVLHAGWNEFPLKLPQAGTHFVFQANHQTAEVEAVYDLREETPPVLVGFDMTTVPHDGNGFMDWLLEYTSRSQLANLVVFRNFIAPVDSRAIGKVAPELLKRWGEFCARHAITVEAATDFENGVLAKAAGKWMHSAGAHECNGPIYAEEPDAEHPAKDMREAAERFIEFMKREVAKSHNAGIRAAFGDASGAIRYSYLAGADFVRAETMVPHTMALCAQARAAAEALGSGEWGVHIAVQHPVQPVGDFHFRLYFLSLYQAWMMGAKMLYEEDSLFSYFKEARQTWFDAVPAVKRQMTRDFLRFAKTHPRRGKVRRAIAFIEGRYAAPFNGIICSATQTPDYAVWGAFGNPAPCWGHRQPEKCRQLLNVLMPGASTLPLRQKIDKRRFFFSGTPYGDFDETPIEASAEFFKQYELLMNLGWNTLLDEDYRKLREFVENGGTLLTGLPEFSTHVKREFLEDMDDLALYRNGDLRELCGFCVKGKNGLYSGQFGCENGIDFMPELIGVPNHSPEEDGPAYRAKLELDDDAEIVAWDALDGAPLVIRHQVGKGAVYTLAFWAYPGHEAFQELSAFWLARLARCAARKLPVHVTDASGEVFWTLREEAGAQVLALLNTDWTVPGNAKQIQVTAGKFSFDFKVKEGVPAFLYCTPERAIHIPAEVHGELNAGTLCLWGTGKTGIEVITPAGRTAKNVDFGDTTETVIEL